ncbi:hypothetical protein ACGF5M_04940 [Gemmatimonadota bacterium]
MSIFGKSEGGGGSGGSKSDLYNDFLQSEGYTTEVDDDGDITFKLEGGNYFLFAQEADREYFTVVFPNFWPIESEDERTATYIACCHATADTKGAKVYPLGDNICASIELFFGEPEDFKPVFKRAMSTVQSAVAKFAEKMRELT